MQQFFCAAHNIELKKISIRQQFIDREWSESEREREIYFDELAETKFD